MVKGNITKAMHEKSKYHTTYNQVCSKSKDDRATNIDRCSFITKTENCSDYSRPPLRSQ